MGEPDPHPLVGRFAPSMELRTTTGTVRLAELTRTARPLLLDLTEDASLAGTLPELHDQVHIVVHIVTASPEPGSPTAMLLRPDRCVAWATTQARPGAADRQALRAARRRWIRPGSSSDPVRSS